jgi:hypothetical protein
VTTGGFGPPVLLAARVKESGCKLGPNPDRACSPGAYDKGLTKTVLCDPSFRTGPIRKVPDSLKRKVKVEYGMQPKKYGKLLEIDHIVSLGLGGSNNIANLFAEGLYAHPGYKAKDNLENRLHMMVCAKPEQISLSSARRRIAIDWQALYRSVFGIDPPDSAVVRVPHPDGMGMGARDVVVVEIGAALTILGLLLVFLPLFLQSAAMAKGGRESQKERGRRIRRAWCVPALIGIAAVDAMLGLLTLWGKIGAANETGWLLIALVWLVAFLAAWAVKAGVS